MLQQILRCRLHYLWDTVLCWPCHTCLGGGAQAEALHPQDSWVEKTRPVKEHQHLIHVAGVHGVPEFVCGEDVSVDGKELCTSNLRGLQLSMIRVRQRIVTASIGSHISDFRTKRGAHISFERYHN